MEAKKDKVVGLALWTKYLLALLAFCLIGTGCGSGRDSVGAARLGADENYSVMLERYTSKDTVFKDLEPRLTVTALLKSGPFREAYAHKYIRDYQLGPERAGDFLATQAELAQGRLEFLLAASSWKGADNDLEKRTSAWRIFLDGDSLKPIEPVEIKLIKVVSPRLLGFFPFISPWDKVYEVRFDIPADSPRGNLTLHVTGVIGAARLNFRM
ncbi:MAG: hypothetical protein V1816_07725 [Pseudomonadota bacterium]